MSFSGVIDLLTSKVLLLGLNNSFHHFQFFKYHVQWAMSGSDQMNLLLKRKHAAKKPLRQTCMSHSCGIPRLCPHLVQLLYSSNSAVFPRLVYFDNYRQTGAWVWASLHLIFQVQLKRPQVEECVPDTRIICVIRSFVIDIKVKALETSGQCQYLLG